MKYGIITTRSIHHEGDERSRTNPGHGYPAHTEKVIDFKEFDNQEACKNWIKNAKEPFRLIEFQDVEVRTEMQVVFKKPVATRAS